MLVIVSCRSSFLVVFFAWIQCVASPKPITIRAGRSRALACDRRSSIARSLGVSSAALGRLRRLRAVVRSSSRSPAAAFADSVR